MGVRRTAALVIALASAIAMPAWAGDIVVEPTGRIYANWHYNFSAYPDWDARVGTNDQHTFELTRGYLGLKAKFGTEWSAVLLADAGQQTTPKVTVTKDDAGNLQDVTVVDQKGPYNFFIKYAYGQWLPKPYVGVRLGAQPVPYIFRYEDAWGYRWIEKTPNDRVGWDSSADLGLAAFGDFPGGYGGYLVMVRNGEGYNKLDVDQGKAFHADVKLNPAPGSEYTKGLQLLLAYRVATVQAHDPGIASQMFDGLLSYQVALPYGLGINVAVGYDWLSTEKAGSPVVVGSIVHGWFTLGLPKGLALFARMDYYDPDLKNDRKTHGYRDEQTYGLAGVSFTPIKGVDLALDYRTTAYDAKVADNQGKDQRKTSDQFVYLNAQFKF
jgi:hypothetical protein